MPPIKVYADAPLRPDGITPKTAEPEGAQVQSVPQPTPTRTTNLPPSDPSAPPPPQPGARPQPPGPTPTATASSGPPPPQPGATPIPVVTATHTTTTTGTVPPPSQLNIPPPTSNQAPTHSTYIPPIVQASHFETGTATHPPTGLHVRKPSLEHPPGYVQNPYAQDGTPSERARFEDAAREATQEEGVMGQLRNAMASAGKQLEAAEEAAWRWAKGKP